MKIVVDALGSDERPGPDVEGAVLSAREFGIGITLVGPRARLEAELARYDTKGLAIEILNATQEIEMKEHPALAVKEKKDSSIVVGIEAVKRGDADAFVSAGNTGAVMAAALLHLQRIPGVKRPSLAAAFPHEPHPVLVLDIGANTDCKPDYLAQFALMGSIYAEQTLGISKPRVALLANGEEETKGNQLVQETFPLLKANPALNFVGNIEGKDVLRGEADVVVCDGFDGNIFLKTTEGTASMMKQVIMEEIKRSPLTAIGGLIAKPAFDRVSRRLDYAEVGGAPFLGVTGVVIIGHGRSNAKAIKNAVRAAKFTVERRVLDVIRAGLGSVRTPDLSPQSEQSIKSMDGSAT